MFFPAVFGVVAGVISFIAFIPYIRSILKGETKPERATFAVWTGVSTLILLSYFASGARDTIWVVLAFSVMQFVIFGLSFKYGMGGFNKLDIACILGALVGIGLWVATNNPTTALYISIFIETMGYIPTIKKSYLLPETENTLAWTLSSIGAVLNLFAITSLSLHIVLYPVAILVADGTVALLLLLPHKRFKKKTSFPN